MASRPLIAVLLSIATVESALAVVPGGLVASHNFAAGPSTSMEVTIAIEAAPPDSSSYFWAQQFFANSTIDHGGYFGIQTGGVIGNQNVGKMLIFSIWNADQAEAGPGATAQPFGGEGVGYSVRLPMQWMEGVPYRFRLEKDGPLWWRLTVSAAGGAPALIGRIRITQDVPLRLSFATFTEFFRDLGSCTDLPYARARFADLVVGTALVPVYDSTPYGTCVAHARGYVRGYAAVHEIRPLFSDGFE